MPNGTRTTNAGKLSNHPLQKGLACSKCKARKVRCDGLQPSCGSCKRTARFEGRDPATVCCVYGKGAGRDVKGKGRVKKESLHLDSPAPLQHMLHSSLQPSIHSAFLSSSFASTSSSSIVSNASDDSYSPSSETENEFWTRYSGLEPDEVPYVPSPLESEFSYAHDPCLNASETLDYSYFTLPTVEIEQASYYHNPFSIFGQTSTFPPQTLVPPSPSYEPFMLPAHFSNPLHQNDTFSLPLYQHLKTGTGLIANFTPFGRLTLSDDAPLGGPAMGQYVV